MIVKNFKKERDLELTSVVKRLEGEVAREKREAQREADERIR